MSDPLSIAASVTALLQLSAATLGYIKDVKHGSVDRARLRDELRSAVCLLEMVRDRIDDSTDANDPAQSPWIAALGGQDGPLELFKRLLEEIVAKLAPQDRLRRLVQPFRWPFDEKDLAKTLAALERLKASFNLVIQDEILTLSKMSNLKLDGVSNKLDSAAGQRREEETEKMLSWFSTLSFRTKQADVRDRVQRGTGQWFLRDEKFLDWANDGSRILWCPGIRKFSYQGVLGSGDLIVHWDADKVYLPAGAGKTMITSLIVEHLDAQTESLSCGLAYIYCDFNKRETQTPFILLSSMLEQLLRQLGGDSIPPEVTTLYELHKKHDTRPALAEIVNVLRRVCQCSDAVRVIIDALDECSPSEEAALDVVSAVLDLGSTVRLLCTSRPSMIFGSYFRGLDAKVVEIAAQSDDIRTFIEANIPRQPRLVRHVRSDPSLKEDIVAAIIEQSRGMFLLAALHFESLSRKVSRREVRNSLATLPKTLDTTYEQALNRIRSQAEEDVQMAETILFWILFSRRPLAMLELQQMYALQSLPRGASLESDDLPDGDILIGVCGGLIVVDSESQTTRMVHYTAQEYFERVDQSNRRQSKTQLTRLSLVYMALPVFADGICTSDGAMAVRLEHFPFLDYAARYWGSAGAEADWATLWDDLRTFVSNEMAVSVAGQVQSLPRSGRRYSNWSQEFPRHVPALVLAASFDLPVVLRQMVREGHELDGQGSDGETALIKAASLGHVGNVSALLDLGASVNASDVNGQTALHRAAARGKVDVLRALLGSSTTDVNAKAAAGWTALMSAVSSGSLEAVRMLVEAGADLSPETDWGDSALSIATRNGHESIAGCLADHGMTLPNTVAGRRASVVASRKGLRELVRRLTMDYRAVAAIGPKRMPRLVNEGLELVKEVEEPPTNDPVHLTEALDGMEYSWSFSRRYTLLEEIGKGHFAVVHTCAHKGTGVRYAVKVYATKDRRYAPESIRDEVASLRDLQHDHIVRVVELCVNESMNTAYIVLDLCPGGELFHYIIRKQSIGEPETRKVMSQIFSALAFIHHRGLIHRDVKPENIFIADEDTMSVKLGDFGLATCVAKSTVNGLVGYSNLLCGTPSYVAPEVLASNRVRKYSYPVDVWSAGVVLYICLCGFPPFSYELNTPENPYTLSEQIRKGIFDYPTPYWDSVGDPAIDPVDNMLVVDPERRYTMQQCIEHPWTKGVP